jgi:Domain of unknown function (DUF1707)
MDTGFPGPTDYSSPRSTSAGSRPGRGNPTARPRNFPSGTLRVSDADRDAALAELSQHYQAGRITTEELDDRTTQILAARTGEELQVQLRDLPDLAAPASTPTPEPQSQQRPLRTAANVAPRLVIVAVVLAAVAIVVALTSGNHGVHVGGVAIPVIVIMLVVRRILGHR